VVDDESDVELLCRGLNKGGSRERGASLTKSGESRPRISPAKDLVIAWYSTVPHKDLTAYARLIIKSCDEGTHH
jgi:hypothetical protein